MIAIKIKGTIVGGPYDGRTIIFDGKSEMTEEEVLLKMDKLQFLDHSYKIIERDESGKHVVLMW